jgi:tryptophan synthase beta chain
MKQMEMAGLYPDIIVGCVGGGSNFGGMLLPYVKDKIQGKRPDLRIICVEPTSCPTLTKGPYAYDFGDVAGLTPLLKMHTLGHGFIPAPVHAGGLRYHGMAPLISHLLHLGFIESTSVPQLATFEAGVTFARVKCRESGEAKTILLAHSGHGHFDMAAYESYFSGKLTDYDYPEQEVTGALASLPKV